MNQETRTRGQQAEDLACRYLRERGYQIVDRNWRSAFGELDIVARDGGTLAIVEVKARSGSTFGGAEAALAPYKRERIVTASRAYLARCEADLPVRFDVVAVYGDQIVLYQDAFRPEGECSLGF
jgi:putative endonuclease